MINNNPESQTDDLPERKTKLSYWSKTKCLCPVCLKHFPKEEMLSGGGRMIAGDLTDELHRTFEKSERYGQIYPLIYAIGACPHCHAAFFWKDFVEIKDAASLMRVREDSENRKKAVSVLFPHYSLTRERNLLDGAAMYYLALLCYEKVDLCYAPTFKRAMITLRSAWLCKDLDTAAPGHNYLHAAELFYRKAQFFYEQTLLNEMSGIESFSRTVTNYGPDIDKNYGYDGIIYLNCLLEYKYGQTEDLSKRCKKLDSSKRAVARLFGLGKSTKAKPGPILEKSRELYDKISAELNNANSVEL